MTETDKASWVIFWYLQSRMLIWSHLQMHIIASTYMQAFHTSENQRLLYCHHNSRFVGIEVVNTCFKTPLLNRCYVQWGRPGIYICVHIVYTHLFCIYIYIYMINYLEFIANIRVMTQFYPLKFSYHSVIYIGWLLLLAVTFSLVQYISILWAVTINKRFGVHASHPLIKKTRTNNF